VSAAQPGLSVDLVGRLATLLAPLTEQNAIAAFLDRETAKIDGLVGEQRRMMELLREKREAVISYAVTMGLNPDVAMKPSGVEWLGNVPAHWRVLPFRRLTTRVDVGIAEAATHAYAEDGVPMVRSTNIKEQFVDSEDLLFLTKEFASRLASKTIHSGDILTTRTGANLGVSAVVPPSLHLAHCFTLLVSTLISECEPRFYNAFINSKPGMAHFAMTAWGASQPNISVPIVKEMPCVQPPIAEQRAIAAFLDEETTRFDTLTTEATRAIDLLQERRTALISAAVTGQIDVRSIGEMQPA